MGFIHSKERILVTGANGFIGAHCIAHLLSQGFQVTASVRTTSKSEQVITQLSSNPLLSVKVVPDLTDPHAFDEAIQGCSGVLHLAAPFGYAYRDFEKELLTPSIDGTKSKCLAAIRTPTRTPTVKRVVLTSSFGAVFDASAGPTPSRVHTEKDWSPLTKALAEKAAWDFSLFDAEQIPGTKAPLLTSAKTLAQAHTLASTTIDAGNERFLVFNSDFDNKELADIIHASEYLPARAETRVPVGKSGDRLKGKVFTADGSKIANILGLNLAASGDDLNSTVVGFLKQALKLEMEGEKL